MFVSVSDILILILIVVVSGPIFEGIVEAWKERND